MDRRRYLRLLGVAGTGALAGCATLGSSPTADAAYEADAEDHLAVAIGNLNTVALAVSTFEAADDPRAQGFDETLPRERLETARAALDDAEDAGGTDTADLEAVREYATVVTGTVDALVDLLVASDTLEETEAQFGDLETDIEAAREAIDEARTASSRAAEARDVAVRTSESVDRDRLVALDAAIEEVRDGLAALSDFVTGVDGLTEGYAVYLDGVADLQRAEDAFEGEAFADAQEDFETARTAFDAAATTFANARPDAAQSLVSDLDLGEARSIALGELSAGYAELSEGVMALEDGQSLLDDGSFDAANAEFVAAGESFATADEQFAAGQNTVEGEFTTEFERARCRAAHLEAAAEHLEAAAEAGSNRNQARLQVKEESAEAELEAAEEC